MIWKSNLYGVNAPAIDWSMGDRPRTPATITSNVPTSNNPTRDVTPVGTRPQKSIRTSADSEGVESAKSSRRNTPEPRRPSPSPASRAPGTSSSSKSPASHRNPSPQTRISSRKQGSQTPQSATAVGIADVSRKTPRSGESSEFKSSQDFSRSAISSIVAPGLDDSRSTKSQNNANAAIASTLMSKMEEILGEVRESDKVHHLFYLLITFSWHYSYNLSNRQFLLWMSASR